MTAGKLATPRFAFSAGWRAVSVAAALYALFLAYFTLGLHFNLLRGDALTYWKESLDWRAYFSTWFMPGYPILISVLRFATLGLLPQGAIMVVASGAPYLLSVWVVYEIARVTGLTRPIAAGVSLVFATFPLTGLTYAAYPGADSLAILLLAAACLAFWQKRWVLLVVFTSLALVTHKATWFFVPLLLALAFIQNQAARKVLPLAFVPLLALEIIGALYNHDVLWMLRWSTANLLTSQSALPVLDGIVGTALRGGVANGVKAAIVLGLLLWALAILLISFRGRLWLAFALALPFVFMILVVNQYEIWSVVRFGRLLLLPSLVVLGARPTRLTALLTLRWLALGMALGIATNLAYGYYMARIYFE